MIAKYTWLLKKEWFVLSFWVTCGKTETGMCAKTIDELHVCCAEYIAVEL